jgi:mannan endo-1,4-beta-mannosidase
MKSANMKVLRVWVDGQSTASTKGTTITSYPDLETTAVGTYDDTVLNLLDDVMVDAHSYGIKLLISMHSWNALSKPDIYGKV